jgi:autotransporter-associated beta strand protein
VAGAVTLTAGGDNTSTAFSGSIQDGSGTVAFTKIGTGTLTLSGANTYTGLTTVSAGTLAYGANNVIATGDITVSGGTLNIAAFSDTVGAVTLTSGTIAGTTGVLTGTSYTVASGTISAILGGAGVTMTKNTAGTVTLSGANTFNGGLTIKAGTVLGTTSASAFGAGNITLGDSAGGSNSATLLVGTTGLTIANPIVLASNTTGTLI